jgi:predicted nucleotidyltransferase
VKARDESATSLLIAPAEVRSAALAQPGLHLLLLVGSRARGEARPASDWDFAYLAGEPFDPDELRRRLSLALGSDQVDLVDLNAANALFRHRAAVDARLVAGEPGLFDDFRIAAATVYLDMEPVLSRAFRDVLAEYAR